MEIDDNMPDRVVELFKEQTPNSVDVVVDPLGKNSIELYPDSEEYPVEFTRLLGQEVIEKTGYAITGMREHDSHIEIWFDPVESDDSSTEHLTVAQRAARCLDHKENDTRFEANISGEPKEQYVDVFPEPVEQASEDYSLKAADLGRLQSEGLEVRAMSCGRERSRFNEENYRIWFTPIED